MELIGFHTIAAAAVTIMQPAIVGWIFIGVLTGLVFGASPGLTATTGVAIVTPLTFGKSFEVSMALLLGMYCAGYFAGSIPAILINTPGAPGNAATALDGHRLARAGHADLAISLAAVASLIGGTVSILILMFAAPQLSSFALEFTSVEYFSLGLFGLTCVAAVSVDSLTKGVIGATAGMLLGTVGIDPVSGMSRFTLGWPQLLNGIPLIPTLIALFAVAEILVQASRSQHFDELPEQQRHPLAKLPGLVVRRGWLFLQGSLIGTLIGILPGAGPTIASWVSYGQARGRDRGDEQVGDSQSRGVIAAEAANNAVTGGALVPLLTLGIPGDTVTAVLIGALLIQGIDPGPFFVVQHANLFAQILLILLISNVMFFIIILAARRWLPKILEIPPRILLPIVGVLCASGGFAISGAAFDVALIAVLGIVGYVMMRFGFSMATVILGLVLGPIIETNLRNGLKANNMDPTVFVSRPISAVLLILLVITLLWAAMRSWRTRRSR